MRTDQLDDIERRIAERRGTAAGVRSLGRDTQAEAIDSDTDMMCELLTAVRSLQAARDALQDVIADMQRVRTAEVMAERDLAEAAKALRKRTRKGDDEGSTPESTP